MKNTVSVAGGIILIALGVILGGNALSIWRIEIFFPGWWTLIIIIPSLINIKSRGLNIGNTVCLAIGVILFLSAWDIFPWHLFWRLIIPVFCILMGLYIIFGRGRNNVNSYTEETVSGKFRVFFSTVRRVISDRYEGGKFSVLLGTGILDLSNAEIAEDISIDIDVLMGSAEIILPPQINIVVDKTPILGTVDGDNLFSSIVNGPTVHLNCSVILGSVELK